MDAGFHVFDKFMNNYGLMKCDQFNPYAASLVFNEVFDTEHQTRLEALRRLMGRDSTSLVKIAHGKRRKVFRVLDNGTPTGFLVKLLQDRDPSGWWQRLSRRVLGALRLDENSREWRALTGSWGDEVRQFIPRAYARGGHGENSIIIVEEVTWSGNAAPLLNPPEGVDVERTIDRLWSMAMTFADNHFVCNDLNQANVVMTDKDGVERPVLIDGFGNNHPIPYPVFSKKLNARKIMRRTGRIVSRLETSAR